MNFLRSLFSPSRPVSRPNPEISRPVAKVAESLPPDRRMIRSPVLEKAAPPGACQVYYVVRSTGTLYLDPHEWEPEAYVYAQSQNRSCFELYLDKQLIAALGWEIEDREYFTTGTYVHEDFRKRGLGKALFEAWIAMHPGEKLTGTPVTDEGYTLLKSLCESYPEVLDYEMEESRFHEDPQDLREMKAA